MASQAKPLNLVHFGAQIGELLRAQDPAIARIKSSTLMCPSAVVMAQLFRSNLMKRE
jgi:hypothetical protein